MNSKEIEGQLARRDRLRRAEMRRLTPEQRMERFWALQEYVFSVLQQSPEGLEQFMRRNFRKRAVPAKRAG
jgi:hypothetical protein